MRIYARCFLFPACAMTLTLFLVPALFMPASAAEVAANDRYGEIRFVANKKDYAPSLAVEKNFINAWGISIRPAGAGGHFWITAGNKSFEYVGDVHGAADEKLRTLHQDNLKAITLPVGSAENFATGTVFSGSKEHFTITQHVKDAAPITAPAKFLFASDGGIISAWTERKKPDGTFDWPAEAVTVIDQSKESAQFFGLAISANYDRLYAADFGEKPAIKVFDGSFKPLPVAFDMPFDTNKNAVVDPGEYAPFNIQSIKMPSGASHLFVAYALTQACPDEEVKKGTCAKGALFAGEEDTSKPGNGRIAEFTEDGKLVAIWNDAGRLSAPWGFAMAPSNFGAYSNMLLVSNFGDGSIAAFNPASRECAGYLNDTQGKKLVIDKIWGILFGNGASLGDANALYYAAGPKDEADGLFGSLRPVE